MRRPFTVRVRAAGGVYTDSSHKRLWKAWERMLWLARSPRGRCVAEVFDADGRKVSAP